MDHATCSEIAHGELRILNPLSAETIDDVIAASELAQGARALDIGCGKGELLIRLAEQRGAHGLGIDISAHYIAEAKEEVIARGPRVKPEFEVADVRQRALQASSFDLAACIGASHASGAGTRGALGALKTLVKPGGLILLGEGFWRHDPSPEYLEALGATRDELTDYGGTLRLGLEAGLTPLYARSASDDDWDRYEWTLISNAERYLAAANAKHPGIDDLRAWVARIRDRLLLADGRSTLGFGLFLFAR